MARPSPSEFIRKLSYGPGLTGYLKMKRIPNIIKGRLCRHHNLFAAGWSFTFVHSPSLQQIRSLADWESTLGSWCQHSGAEKGNLGWPPCHPSETDMRLNVFYGCNQIEILLFASFLLIWVIRRNQIVTGCTSTLFLPNSSVTLLFWCRDSTYSRADGEGEGRSSMLLLECRFWICTTQTLNMSDWITNIINHNKPMTVSAEWITAGHSQ